MMMTNLFSIFDPSLSLFSSFWSFVFIVLLIFPGFYYTNNFLYLLSSSVFEVVAREVRYAMAWPGKGGALYFGSMFIFLLTFNLTSIFPHISSVTGHLMFTVPLSFSVWFGILLFVWTCSFKSFLIHLVPVATPVPLMSFMVLVETLSSLMRPMALTFRLTVNLMAGHLILSLLSGALVMLGGVTLLGGALVLFLLIFMELGVCFVQAYVFCSLVLLYSSEAEL